MGKGKKKSKSKTTSKSGPSEQNLGNVQNPDAEEKNTSSEMQVEEIDSREDMTYENSQDDGQASSSKSNKNRQTINAETSHRTTDNTSQSNENVSSKKSGFDVNTSSKDGYKNSRDYTKAKKEGASSYQRRSEPFKRSKYDQEDEGRDTKRYSCYDNVTEKRYSHNYPRRNSDVRSKYRQSSSQTRKEDSEFTCYKKEFERTKDIEYIKTKEIDGDLFLMPKEYSLAHCVAEDMNMGSGIAVQFRRDFKRVDELLNQRQKTGGLAVLKDGERYIYYLVTKRYSSGKPTYSTLFSSLQELRKCVIENNIKKLAMPRIGCGLDRLEWDNVKFMIEFVFKEVDVEIVICNLQLNEESTPVRHRNCKLTNVTYPIQDIEEGTIIVYLSSEDEFISDEMFLLDQKFHFLREFRTARKALGNVIFFNKNENYLLCGCIVRKAQTEPIDFKSFNECLFHIQKENKKTKFEYIAFQAIKDEDPLVNHKIINLLRNSMRYVEVYVCWPDDLQNDMNPKDTYSDYVSRSSLDRNNTSQSSNWRNYNRESENLERPQKDNRTKSGDSWANNSKPRDSGFNKDEWARADGSKNSSEPTETISQNDEWFQSSSGTSETVVEKDKWVKDKYSSESTPLKSEQDWCQDDLEWDTKEASMNVSDCFQTDESMEIENVSTHEESESNCNHEYELYEMARESDDIELPVATEINTNELKTCSRACFVTEDMNVIGDTALGHFLGELLNQKQKEGGLAIVKDGYNYLYCLVVQQLLSSKPTSHAVFATLQKMRNHAKEHRVIRLVVPNINDGGDSTYKWSTIKYMLGYLFRGLGIKINFSSQSNKIPKSPKPTNKLVHVKSPLYHMKKQSLIIYFGSADGRETEEMRSLSRTFKFMGDFNKSRKTVGNVIPFEDEAHVLFGCIIKKEHNDTIDFAALQKCILTINKDERKRFPLVGVQAVKDDDENINYKIATVLLNTLQNITINMCWPGNLKQNMPINKP